MVLFKLTERSIGFVSTLILARLLTPADFGLVAMAMSVVSLIELMSAVGFDTVLIQRQDAQRVHFDTAWTFNVLFGVATAGLLLAMSLPAANFYRDPRLSMILPALAVGALVQGFENIGTIAFRKNLDFQREFRFLLSKKVITFLMTIGLALTFRSYWALIGGTVTGKLFSVWISYRLQSYRPKFTLAARHDLFHFSKWIFISNLLLFLQNKSDNFILGRTVGAGDLGIYNIAAEIAVMPSTELIAPINRAVYPAYARIANDLPALRLKFLEVFRTITLIAFPVSMGLACIADSAVKVLLGPQWYDAVPLIQLFVLNGLTGALQSNLYIVIVALGHPRTNTMMTAGMLVIYLPAMIMASTTYGTYGAAWVHLVMCVLVLIPLNVVFLRLTELPFRDYWATLWRPSLASIIMGGMIFATKTYTNDILSTLPILELLVNIAIGAICYVIADLILWNLSGRPKASAEGVMLNELTERFRAYKTTRR